MADSSSEDDSTSRKEILQKLVSDIQKRRKSRQQTKNQTKKQRRDFTMSAKRDPDPVPNPGQRGKHNTYKMYVGHQHFSKGKYRVVTIKKGGGIRQINYKADEDLSVRDIIDKVTPLFFPEGKSHFGDLKNMDISLASFSSENIEAFKDVAGQECSFNEYVKSLGLFSSQYHLYLRSKEKDESACSSATGVESLDFTVNGKKPGELNIKFLKKTQSAYSESDCSIVCRSIKNCFNITSDSPDASYEEYICPTPDGFLLTNLEKDNNVYLTETSEGDIQIFSHNNPAECEYLNSIVYGPGTIYGLNHGDLLIGCISTYHNQGTRYKWFRNNEDFFEETNAAIIKVTLPGVYTVGVYINGNLHMSEEQCIVSNCQDSQEPNSISNHLINQGEENKQLPVISLQQVSTQLPSVSKTENSILQDDNESSCGISEEQCILGKFLKSQEPNSINQGKENKQFPVKSIQQPLEKMPSVSKTENSSVQDDNESSCGISEEQCILGKFLKSQEPNSIKQGKENKQFPVKSIKMPSVSKTEIQVYRMTMSPVVALDALACPK